MPLRPVLTLTLLLCLAVPLQAQQEQGDVELQFTGSLISTVGQEDISSSSGIVQAKLGYFFTDRVELGIFPSLLFTETRVGSGQSRQTFRDTRIGMGAFGTYSFLAENAMTVPYLGAQFYRSDLSDDDETGWVGVNGGFKHYLSRSMAFDLGGNYLFGLGDAGGALVLFQVGISFLL